MSPLMKHTLLYPLSSKATKWPSCSFCCHLKLPIKSRKVRELMYKSPFFNLEFPPFWWFKRISCKRKALFSRPGCYISFYTQYVLSVHLLHCIFAPKISQIKKKRFIPLLKHINSWFITETLPLARESRVAAELWEHLTQGRWGV